MAALQAGVEQANADKRLPLYHFRPQAGWMGDLNGPIYYKGYYHIFYQHYPYGTGFVDNVYWGHARSKDLVYWEHLPIALAPSKYKGEKSCYSGDIIITKSGTPMILYTSIPEKIDDIFAFEH